MYSYSALRPARTPCSALRPARMHWNEIWQCSDEQVRHDNDVLSSPVEIVVMQPITRAKRLTVGWDLARHICGCHASSVCADNRCSGIVVRPDFLVQWLPLPVHVMFGRSQDRFETAAVVGFSCEFARFLQDITGKCPKLRVPSTPFPILFTIVLSWDTLTATTTALKNLCCRAELQHASCEFPFRLKVMLALCLLKNQAMKAYRKV